MDGIDIFCGGCGDTATVTKVTAGLRHTCGSTKIGVVGIDPMPSHLAAEPTAATRECDGCDGTGSHWGPLRPDMPYKAHGPCGGTGRVSVNTRPGGYVHDPTRHATLRPVQAAPHGPGTGWGKPMPDPAANWSSYVGPPATANPVTAPPVSDNMTCPTCRGAGYDVNDKAICRECGGSGKLTATTSAPAVGQYDSHQGPPVGGARHAAQASHVAGRPSTADPYGTAEYQNAHGGGDYAGRGAPSGDFNPEDASTFYPKTDSQSPGAQVRQQRDYDQGARYLHQLNEAPCPECGHAPTVLVKTQADRHGNQDAVWHCPSCGPLVNIDKNPSVNPYRPHETGYAKPDRKALKTSRLAGLAEVTRLGKLLPIMATIQASNAVSVGQSLTLARQTLLAYPEGRS